MSTIDALERVEEKQTKRQSDEGENLITLTNGTVLEFLGISPFLIIDIESDPEFQHPPVPMVFNPDKERDEPNPQHPDYLAKINRIESAKGTALIEAILSLGCRVRSVPKNAYPLESKEWEEAAIRAIPSLKAVPTEGSVRKMLWIKYALCSDANDTQELTDALRKRMGITEEEVGEALAGFPGGEERDTD